MVDMIDRLRAETLRAAQQTMPVTWNNQLAVENENVDAQNLAVSGPKRIDPFSRDSIAPYSRAMTQELRAECASQDPQLEPPQRNEVVNKKKVIAELKDVFQNIKNIDSDKEIVRLIFLGLQTQRENRGVSLAAANQQILREQDFQKRRQEAAHKLHKECDEAASAIANTRTSAHPANCDHPLA